MPQHKTIFKAGVYNILHKLSLFFSYYYFYYVFYLLSTNQSLEVIKEGKTLTELMTSSTDISVI